MYLAFFSWYMIVGDQWGWAKIPTVILFSALSVIHACLLLTNAFGVSNEKG
jgi:hypothetical protein